MTLALSRRGEHQAPSGPGGSGEFVSTLRVRRALQSHSLTNMLKTALSEVAGGSARREHERRKSAREQRIRANHPKLGGLILALSDEPQTTRAWEQGAIGEELLAERLKDLPSDMRILHDRRVPGSRANIDHIVVSSAGVWVIDAKRYKDKRPELRVEGGIIRPRVESLRVGGRDRTKLVDGVRSQVEQVAGAVAARMSSYAACSASSRRTGPSSVAPSRLAISRCCGRVCSPSE